MKSTDVTAAKDGACLADAISSPMKYNYSGTSEIQENEFLKRVQNVVEISDWNQGDDMLRLFAERSERVLAHYREPLEGYFLAESPNVISRALEAGYRPHSFLIEKEQLRDEASVRILAAYPKVPVYAAPHALMSQIIGYQLLRGMLCLMERRPFVSTEQLCASAHRVAVLEDVVNPANVGAIFRSAAALGMDTVLLTKGCSDPLYRRAARVSMGTVFQVPWTWLVRDDWMTQLHELGFVTAAMALCDDTVSIDDPVVASQEKLAVILGTEGEGLKKETIAASDYTVKIPMAHGVDSLNVAAASAVAFWQLGRQKRDD